MFSAISTGTDGSDTAIPAGREVVDIAGAVEAAAEAEPFVDSGEEVLVVAREHATGRTRGANVSSTIYLLFSLREGKIASYKAFFDERPALTAVWTWG